MFIYLFGGFKLIRVGPWETSNCFPRAKKDDRERERESERDLMGGNREKVVEQVGLCCQFELVGLTANILETCFLSMCLLWL